MLEKISIIIPVYNVEDYLENSIKSIISQTIFENLEIILVDDGSIDKSYEIGEDFSEKYKNIKIIKQENKGVSAARNTGLDVASGEYIAFFDSDDQVKPDMYEFLYRLIKEEEADISLVDFSFVRDCIEYKKRKKQKMVLKGTDFILQNYLSGNIFVNSVCDKLFRKEILEGLRFPVGYSVGEDMYFQYQVLKKAQKIAVDTTDSKYMYIVREESAMTNRFNDRFFDTIELSKKIVEENKENSEIFCYAKAHEIHETCKVLEYMYLAGAEVKYKKERDKLLKSIKQYRLKSAYSFLTRRQFLGFLLMRISPRIYVYIYKILQKKL